MRTAPARPARVLVALALASAALVAPAAPALAGAEYDMVTRASYVVDEAEGRVVVTVDIDFTNTFAPCAALRALRQREQWH